MLHRILDNTKISQEFLDNDFSTSKFLTFFRVSWLLCNYNECSPIRLKSGLHLSYIGIRDFNAQVLSLVNNNNCSWLLRICIIYRKNSRSNHQTSWTVWRCPMILFSLSIRSLKKYSSRKHFKKILPTLIQVHN